MSDDVIRLPEAGQRYAAPEGARVFEIIVPEDSTTEYGNVRVPAGRYEAFEDRHEDSPEGCVTVYPDHYTKHHIWVGLSPWEWHFPGEAPRPLPAHDCEDHLKTGVVAEDATLYCGVCRAEF